MSMKNAYARNADGTLKRKQPCTDCDHPNWHVCPNRMGPDTTQQLLRRGVRVADRNNWALIREANKETFAKIVTLYEEGYGVKELAAMYRYSPTKVTRILTDAEEDQGRRIRRQPGHNLMSFGGLPYAGVS